MPFGATHKIIRALANAAVNSFVGFFLEVSQRIKALNQRVQYATIEVVGEENVPAEGPLLLVANHWAMTVDPAMLSCNVPHRRMLHYWAKDSLFKNKYAARILLDAGNLPVDRKAGKNNPKLFASTFEVFNLGEAVAVFPEGTSRHVPGITTIKDGPAWTALEYAKQLRERETTTSAGGAATPPQDVKIVVCGINYTDKTRYRSCVVLEYGPPIDVAPYVEEFLEDGRSAVKKLSAKILSDMTRLTVTAPDWDSLDAAITARQLLWRYDTDMPLPSFRPLSQSLVDHFADAATPSQLKTVLLDFNKALIDAKITSSSLGPATLPRDLDPNKTVPLPSRISSLFALLKSTLASAVRLPFFLLPLIIHLPTYLAGRLALPLINPNEPESFAQNKIVLGLLFLALTYPSLFFFMWALFVFNPLGGAASFAFVYWFARYHNRMIDSQYRRGRRLMTSWRIVLSIWLPSIAAAGKPYENRVRRVLRLRGEAARALHSHLIALEHQGGKGAALVSRLRAAGAQLSPPADLSATSADERSPSL